MNDAETIFAKALKLQAAGDFAQAETMLRALLAGQPGLLAAQNNLAVCLLELGRPEEALSLLEGLAKATGAAQALANWGNALRALGRFAQAEAAYRQVLEKDDFDARAQSNLALSLQDQGRVEEAVAGFARAVALAPGDPALRANLGGALLMAGDFKRGFPAYEFRLAGSATEAMMKAAGLPLWDGGPLDGRPLLVWTEQGLGDSLQFLRFLEALDGPVELMAQTGLARLAARIPNVRAVHGWRDAPPSDCKAQIALLSLPRLLGCASEADIPPFRLSPDPLLADLWAERLAQTPVPRIGLSWRGNPAMKADRTRSASLADFAPLFARRDISWISLQTGDVASEIARCGRPMLDLGSEISDMADTAAIMSRLDLVIGVDSAPAHLAGCLGVPVWIMVRANPDWRWKPGASTSPWYPSARLWRQETLGDWRAVVAAMAEALPTFSAIRP